MNRIAIVEDDQGYRDTLFIYIKQYEQERDTAFEATPFEKADDFLAVYNGDYDIILMDIEMPGTNGMDAAEQIRKKDAQVSSCLSRTWRTMRSKDMKWAHWTLS